MLSRFRFDMRSRRAISHLSICKRLMNNSTERFLLHFFAHNEPGNTNTRKPNTFTQETIPEICVNNVPIHLVFV